MFVVAFIVVVIVTVGAVAFFVRALVEKHWKMCKFRYVSCVYRCLLENNFYLIKIMDEERTSVCVCVPKCGAQKAAVKIELK